MININELILEYIKLFKEHFPFIKHEHFFNSVLCLDTLSDYAWTYEYKKSVIINHLALKNVQQEYTDDRLKTLIIGSNIDLHFTQVKALEQLVKTLKNYGKEKL